MIQAEEIPRKWFVRVVNTFMRNVVEGPRSTFGIESKGELACQLHACNSACIIHNVTEAWGWGRRGKHGKNRASCYSVAGAGDGRWPRSRPPIHPMLLICAFEEEKPVSCDKLKNSKFVFLGTVNRLSQTYQILISGDGVCVISGMQEFWKCQVCWAAWPQWKGNGSGLHCGSWQRTLTSLCSKLVRGNCGLNRQTPGHNQRVVEN